MNTFLAEFEKQLRDAVVNNPGIYSYENTDCELSGVIAKYRELLIQRSKAFIIDGTAMKATCKALKIKNTYKDIFRFIDNHV